MSVLTQPKSFEIPNPITWIKKDARHFQIVYLTGFLLFGIFKLGWEADIFKYVAIFATGLAIQSIGIHFTTKNYTGLKSALITCLGLCLLLNATSIWIFILATAIAIGSKFLIRFKGKHLFNPANIGLVAAILITGQAWVSPGQWGSSVIFVYFLGAAALIVLLKVGRIDTSLAFLGTFSGLVFIKTVLYQGWPLDHFVHYLSNGTLLLFTFFMITDPVTTPRHSTARIIWAAVIGIITFILASEFHVNSAAPIWALIAITPFTIILNKIFKAKQFKW